MREEGTEERGNNQYWYDQTLRHSIGVWYERESFINISTQTWSRLLCLLSMDPRK
jgi:hypothetical protein